MTLRCVGVEGLEGGIMSWKAKYAVELTPSKEVMEDVTDESEWWIAQGGVFDFVQKHYHPPQYLPRILDTQACRTLLGEPVPEHRAAGGGVVESNSVDNASTLTDSHGNPRPVARTESGRHYSTPYKSADFSLDMVVLGQLPYVGRLPPVRPYPSHPLSPSGVESWPAPFAPKGAIDPLLAASVFDKLGYHVGTQSLQQQDHEWFGAVRGFECGIKWLVGKCTGGI
ncbi:hypothetical protein HDU93_009312 [Gonapodya sp. JEL0774]|nr:hypothetical protein HDU93_009312 [Gonapodya sp. JEL0774]